tara:strand:- start:64 stop:516 length:453 start_codon:yes stop_codon:yes gene_type:complete
MAYKNIDGKIIEAANSSSSASAAASVLGIRYSTYKKHAERLGVFKTNQSGRGISKRAPDHRKLNLSDVLEGKRPETQTGTIKRHLLADGIKKNECEVCELSEWNGKPISCHLDHINGINNDHRLENLRMICPNCHSQTDTYCGKNKGTLI